MLRLARLAFIAFAVVVLYGCTSEVKNNSPVGLMEDVPTGTVQSQYGTGHGDSVGGGGASPALDLNSNK